MIAWISYRNCWMLSKCSNLVSTGLSQLVDSWTHFWNCGLRSLLAFVHFTCKHAGWSVALEAIRLSFACWSIDLIDRFVYDTRLLEQRSWNALSLLTCFASYWEIYFRLKVSISGGAYTILSILETTSVVWRSWANTANWRLSVKSFTTLSIGIAWIGSWFRVNTN